MKQALESESDLEFGIWDFFWNLSFGIWSFRLAYSFIPFALG